MSNEWSITQDEHWTGRGLEADYNNFFYLDSIWTRDVNRAATAFRVVRFWKILPRTSRDVWLLKILSRASAAYSVDVHLMMNLCKTERFFGSYCFRSQQLFFLFSLQLLPMFQQCLWAKIRRQNIAVIFSCRCRAAVTALMHCTIEVDKKWSLDSAEADSACLLRMRSPNSFLVSGDGAEEEFVFFIIFLQIWNSWLLQFFLQSFMEDSLCWHSIELFCGQKFFFASHVAQCMQNRILFWTFKPTHLGLLVWSPYSLLVILILDMWFCNLFNVSVRQSVRCSWTTPLRPFVVLTCHRTQTQVALFARGFCVIDGYCQHFFM